MIPLRLHKQYHLTPWSKLKDDKTKYYCPECGMETKYHNSEQSACEEWDKLNKKKYKVKV